MTRPLLGVIVAWLCAGCVPEEICERRIDAAHRDALRDADMCAFTPDALAEPECENLDRRPLTTYYAVYCSTAALDCIRDDEDADLICFGSPESLTPDP